MDQKPDSDQKLAKEKEGDSQAAAPSETKVPHLIAFYEIVNNRFRDQLRKAKELRISSVLAYENLEYYFLPGDDIISSDQCGSIISKVYETK